MTGSTSRRILFASVLVCAVPAMNAAGAQDLRSSAVAGEVASLMTHRQLEAFASQDPGGSTRFYAALVIPNVQMLVVSAEYPNVAELQSQLAQKNYRDVYAALHQPSTQNSRFFLIDLACDGLRSGGDNVDVLYEKGTTQTLFDGDWKKQGLSEATYRQRLANAEAQYARSLTVLRNALTGASTVSTASR